MTPAVGDGDRAIHARVNDLGVTAYDDPLALLQVDLIVIDGRGVGMSIDYRIERKFLCGFRGMIGLVNLFREGAYRKGPWGSHAEAGCCRHLVDSGGDPRINRNPVVQRFVTGRMKLRGCHRDLLAPDAGVGEE